MLPICFGKATKLSASLLDARFQQVPSEIRKRIAELPNADVR